MYVQTGRNEHLDKMSDKLGIIDLYFFYPTHFFQLLSTLTHCKNGSNSCKHTIMLSKYKDNMYSIVWGH